MIDLSQVPWYVVQNLYPSIRINLLANGRGGRTVLMLEKYRICPRKILLRRGELTTLGGIMGFLALNLSIMTKIIRKTHEATRNDGLDTDDRKVPPSVVPNIKDVTAKKNATIPAQSNSHRLTADWRSTSLIETGS